VDIRSPASARLVAYPALTPYRTGRLRVSALHDIYFEECGNPSGRPVAVVHGGPGGGSNPFMRRFHDPSAYRIILFDQRGCGRSTPHAELCENTTWDLVADMEQLRSHLGIENWQVFGGSWGATLALTYAINHPDRVSELVLRGIFLMRRSEVEWFYQDGCNKLFPDHYAPFASLIPPDERDDMIAAYHRRLTGNDRQLQLAAAKAWSRWEGNTLSLMPSPSQGRAFAHDRFALAFARIECHYFYNRGFYDTDDYLLRNSHALRSIPAIAIQGRYDVVTPMSNAWALKSVFPELDLRIVPDAGHAMTEPGIVDELVRATQAFAAA